MPHPASVEDDVRAIERLNQQDVNAVLAGDVSMIVSQWSDDFTVLPPVGPIVRGRAANAEMAERSKEQIRAFEPLDFAVDFEEINVVGEYAYEWGSYRGSTRPRNGGETIHYGGKLMRILQRQRDGSWKMHRTMLTSDPPR